METIAAREKHQQLNNRFSEWVWKDEGRAKRLARDYNNYNDRFHKLRLRTFDGSHLTFPGVARGSVEQRPAGLTVFWPTAASETRK
jgi:N12 class adenine-specific DNA methylase